MAEKVLRSVRFGGTVRSKDHDGHVVSLPKTKQPGQLRTCPWLMPPVDASEIYLPASQSTTQQGPHDSFYRTLRGAQYASMPLPAEQLSKNSALELPEYRPGTGPDASQRSTPHFDPQPTPAK